MTAVLPAVDVEMSIKLLPGEPVNDAVLMTTATPLRLPNPICAPAPPTEPAVFADRSSRGNARPPPPVPPLSDALKVTWRRRRSES